MDQEAPTRAERRDLTRLAQTLVEVCVRNSGIEDLHAGTFPDLQRGDFSDVKVVSPYGEIPWTDLSRISDEEMKRLMIEIVDRSCCTDRVGLCRELGSPDRASPVLTPGCPPCRSS